MILVTGATGLLGSHLLYDLVSSGHHVRALYRNRSRIQKTEEIFSYYGDDAIELLKKVEWVKADITDLSQLDLAMEGIDEIYHCAGVVSFNKRDHHRIMKTNVEGTSNMVNLANEKGIAKFCHVSSIASFGRPDKNKSAIDESVQREENERYSIYSESKYLAELEVWRAIEEGLNAVIINPSTILGSGNWDTGSSALFPRISKGLSYYTEGVNGFVDVRDVVKIMKTLMEKNIFKDQYILVGEHISFRDLLSGIAGNLNLKAPSIKANKFISSLVWRLEDLRCAITRKEPLITRESARIALDTQFYSNKKIRDLLKLDFIPIESTLRVVSGHFLKPIPSASSQVQPAFQRS